MLYTTHVHSPRPLITRLAYLGICLLLAGESLAQTPQLQLALVTTGLIRPTDVAGIGPGEFLVGQTDGKIRLIRQGTILATPFLDLTDLISDPTYEGIFGITIHTDYASNGFIYVHYARKNDRSSVFARFTRKSTNPDQADWTSQRIYFTVPYTNPLGGHRSGRIGFGPDGYLYMTTGDSSPGARDSIGDPDRLAQDIYGPYGKLFRIDVNQGSPYAIPPDNPYADPNDGVPDELYALGMRNPWRWSFDRQTGDFWMADVGQDGWEELNFTAANAPALQNYGWPCFEGNHPYNTGCTPGTAFHMPLLEYEGYSSGIRASITGGFVYRGNTYPDLKGWYVYGDFERGTYWTLKRAADNTYQQIQQSIAQTTSPVSFGEGTDGELYVLSFNEGALYQIITQFVGPQTIASIQSGNWLSPATWNCQCVPGTSDEVTIATGHTILVDQSVSVKKLVLAGKLSCMNGGRVSF
jgi:glucose/arabinose dehydrogenase